MHKYSKCVIIVEEVVILQIIVGTEVEKQDRINYDTRIRKNKL